MKFRELKKSLSFKIEAFYAAVGDDAFLLERSKKLIADACRAERTLDYTEITGNEVGADPEILYSSLYSAPFLSDKRVVVVKEFYPNAAELKRLKSYLAAPPETSVLVVCNSGKSDMLIRLTEATYVDCSKGDEGLVSAFVYGEAKKAGTVFTSAAVAKINEYCKSDMARINGEVQKLIAYAYDSKIVDEEDVEILTSKEAEDEVFKVADLISDKKYDEAYAAIKETAENAGDGQKLFAALYGHFRRLLYVSVSPYGSTETAEMLGVKEGAVKIAQRQAKKFTPKRLMTVVDALSRYDESLKQGKIDRDAALWNGLLTVLAC